MYKNQLVCKKNRTIKTDLNTYQGKLKLHLKKKKKNVWFLKCLSLDVKTPLK